MRLKYVIIELLDFIKGIDVVKSCGYGEVEAYDNSKKPLGYPRAYLHLDNASLFTIELELIVTDQFKNDFSDRLDADARSLDIIATILRKFRDEQVIKEMEDIELEPTGFIGADQTTGFKAKIKVHLGSLDTCNNNNI